MHQFIVFNTLPIHPNILCCHCEMVFDIHTEYNNDGKCPSCFKLLPMCDDCKCILQTDDYYEGDSRFNEPETFYRCDTCNKKCKCIYEYNNLSKIDDNCPYHQKYASSMKKLRKKHDKNR